MRMSKEEKQIIGDLEKGYFKSVSKKEKQENIRALKNAYRKDTAISLRMNKKDLDILKKKAEREGIPYQTLINSVLHKYINNAFVDVNEVTKIKKLLAA